MLFVLVFGVQAANAQRLEVGPLDVLKGERNVNVNIDYSNATIMHMSEEEFAEYEDDWDDDQPIIFGCFLENANRALDDILYLTKTNKANYTLHWVIFSIDTKGNIRSDVYLENNDGEVLAIIEGVNGEGGMFGTKLNLIKDRAQDASKQLGKFLAKHLR